MYVRNMWLRTTLEGPWPQYMILEVSWMAFGHILFGFSQSHGHGSWLVWPLVPNLVKSGQTFLSNLCRVHLVTCDRTRRQSFGFTHVIKKTKRKKRKKRKTPKSLGQNPFLGICVVGTWVGTLCTGAKVLFSHCNQSMFSKAAKTKELDQSINCNVHWEIFSM